MRLVQLAQVNYRYDRNVFLPYSVGLLQAFALSQPDLASVYEFSPSLFLRDPIEPLVSRMRQPDVLGLSCYVWNWEYSMALAQAVRSKWPDALIVVGGTQVPRSDSEFFRKYPYIDLAVPHEGELVFANILRERMKEAPDFRNVDGLMLNDSGEVHRTAAASRVDDLDSLPSPYLTGVFDEMIEEHQFDFQASQETHRGCPYSCTFCDWGAATMSKVRRFNTDRIINEFDWMGRNGIELLYNCDANFGLFKGDVAITEKLVDTKRVYGAPTKFRAAYAKNSNDRVYEIASMLNEEGMCKGVTLSFQSLDKNVLDVVKRKNMKANDFAGLMKMYRSAGIPTYSELILGLPGETYDTFREGISTLLEAGQHDSINIYHAMLLPNSEMNAPLYRHLHGIRSVRTPLLLLHGSKEAWDVEEFYDVVVATDKMSAEDWVKASLYGYVVQALHCMNVTQVIAVGLRRTAGVSYRDFYEGLIEYARARPSGQLWGLLSRIERMLRAVAAGKGSFDLGDRTFGDLMWPVEELLFLWIVQGRVTGEIHDYTRLLDGGEDLIARQKESTNWPEQSDMREFGKNVVWYGRKGGNVAQPEMEMPC